MTDHHFRLRKWCRYTRPRRSSHIALAEARTHGRVNILKLISSQHMVWHRIFHLRLSAFNMGVHNAADLNQVKHEGAHRATLQFSSCFAHYNLTVIS